MSEANKCDKCGILYEHDYKFYIRKHIIYKDRHPYPDYRVDLCPKCQAELEKWLGTSKETKENKQMTNGEWLRSLNDEELANWLCNNLYNPVEDRYYGLDSIKFADLDSILGLQKWLKKEKINGS